MNLEVMSRAKAEKYALQEHREKSIVISISDCGQPRPFIVPNIVSGIIDVLYLSFNDTDDSNPIYGCMQQEDGYKIRQYLEKYLNEINHLKLIVHCGAGQSRSAGVAAAILKYLTNDDTQIFDNHRYTPNMLCYRITLNSFY